jgi:ABC-type dipeptide/oligopeptide/nickel transport system permease component
VPTSEIVARSTGSVVWALAALFGGVAYATRDDEGWDSLGDALTLVVIAAPAFLLAVATLVALVVRLRSTGAGPVRAVTWVVSGPPSVLGVLVLALQITRWF